MAGNPFRTHAPVPAPARPSTLRNASSTKPAKIKKVQFVSPPPSPDEVRHRFDDIRPTVKSPPPNGQFDVDVKDLLQSGTSDEMDLEQRVADMVAQQQNERMATGASGRPPVVQFASGSATTAQKVSQGNTVESTKKMDVDAFTRMLMTGSTKRPDPVVEPPRDDIDGDGDFEEADETSSVSAASTTSSSVGSQHEPDATDDTKARATPNTTEVATFKIENTTEVQEESSAVTAAARKAPRPPTPPATRRKAMAMALGSAGSRSRSNSGQDRRRLSVDHGTGHAKEAPPPPVRRSSGRLEPSTISQAPSEASASALTPPNFVAHSSGTTPPAPPPPRRKHDSNKKTGLKSDQNRQSSSTESRSASSLVHNSANSSHATDTAKSAADNGSDMLADLDALQREVDALRSKVGKADQ